MFSRDVTNAIKADALNRYPEESCGIVVEGPEKPEYLPLPNVALDPTQTFHIRETTLVPYLGKIRAIIHSHPDGPDCPSESDMVQQLAWNVPFGIVTTDGKECLEPFYWGEGVPIPKLIGRGFRHGVTDCYAEIKDYYRVELGIKLKEYPREWKWWQEEGPRLYERNFEGEGFFRIEPTEVRTHDCFLAKIRSDTPNHAGIYVGKNMVLHHLTAQFASEPECLSRRDPISRWYGFIDGFWVRHESLRDVKID